MVPYLLKLLEGVGLENLESPSATKAQIVKTLKSMSRSLQYGEQVSTAKALTGLCTLGRSNSEHPLFNLMAVMCIIPPKILTSWNYKVIMGWNESISFLWRGHWFNACEEH